MILIFRVTEVIKYMYLIKILAHKTAGEYN